MIVTLDDELWIVHLPTECVVSRPLLEAFLDHQWRGVPAMCTMPVTVLRKGQRIELTILPNGTNVSPKNLIHPLDTSTEIT